VNKFGSSMFGRQADLEVEMTTASSQHNNDKVEARENASQAVLARHLLKADDVELIDRIGAGAFGEVGYQTSESRRLSFHTIRCFSLILA